MNRAPGGPVAGSGRVAALERARTRRRRWLRLGLGGALACALLYVALSRIWSPFQGAWAVMLLGGVAVALMLPALTYSLRKRLRLAAGWRLDEWLLAHNVAAGLALLVAGLHALLSYRGDLVTWLGALWNDVSYPDDPNTSLSATLASWTLVILAATVLTGLLGWVLRWRGQTPRAVLRARLGVHVVLAGLLVGAVVGHVVLVIQEDAEASAAVADLRPTYSSLQADLFQPTCSQRSCHSSLSEKGGLVLTRDKAYQSLVNARADNEVAKAAGEIRVRPGDPDGSFLVKKLTNPGPGEGDLMPKRSHALPPRAVEVVRAWIAAGAPKD